MGIFENIPDRENATTAVDASWWNTIKTALVNAFPDLTALTGDLVGTTDAQVLTNKSFDDELTLKELTGTLTTPGAGYKKVYPKTDGNLYTLNSAGNEVQVGGGSSSLAVETRTTTYTLTTSNDVVLADCSGGAFTLTLPTAVGNTGKVFRIKKIDSNNSNVATIDGNASETIDGASNYKLNAQNDNVTLVSDGSNFRIISEEKAFLSSFITRVTSYASTASPNTWALPDTAVTHELTPGTWKISILGESISIAGAGWSGDIRCALSSSTTPGASLLTGETPILDVQGQANVRGPGNLVFEPLTITSTTNIYIHLIARNALSTPTFSSPGFGWNCGSAFPMRFIKQRIA